MNLFSVEGKKYTNIVLDKDIFNYNNKIIDYIKNPKFLIDNDLLKILKLNYIKYGLIFSSIIKNNKLNNINIVLYSTLQLRDELINVNIICPNILLEQVNNYINNISNILQFLEEKYTDIMEHNNNIFIILTSLRNNDYFKYLNNLLNLNNIRLVINRIFFEYYQDLIFYYNKFKQIKYDNFITENNIKLLLNNFENLKNKIDIILKQNINLLIENNTKEFNIKNSNGSIKYTEFINIIERCIENI